MFGLFAKKPPGIFVQIAAYRDPECQWTVKDLFEKAERPERVFAGICWQCDLGLDKDCFEVEPPRPKQVRSVVVHPSETKGVCWARAQVQKLYHGEDYVLMIDSHMRFVRGWDTALIKELKRCPSEKPVISSYPPGYRPPNELEPDPRPIVMLVRPFNEKGALRMTGESLMGEKPEKPLRGAFLAGGFIFTYGRFVKEVPYDPYLYFDHEEIMLAARAYTHGWDIYHSPETFVYHYYNIPEGPKRHTHWADNPDWVQYSRLSHARYEYLLAGIQPDNPDALKEIEKHGLGTARSLADFEAFTGLDFRNKKASERALRGQFIESLDRYRKRAGARRLVAGDMLPSFKIADAQGKLHAPPMPGILCLLPAKFEAYLDEFFADYAQKGAAFAKLGVPLLFVIHGTAEDAKTLRKRYNIAQDVFADPAAAMWKHFGQEDTRLQPLSCALDAEGKIAGVFDNRNARNHMGDLLRAARAL